LGLSTAARSEQGNSAAVGKPSRNLKSSIVGLRFFDVVVAVSLGLELCTSGEVVIQIGLAKLLSPV
jgi:hypothetical protein